MSKDPSKARWLIIVAWLVVGTSGQAKMLHAAEPRVEAAKPSTPTTTAASRTVPASIQDLRAMQDRVQSITQRVMPATVGVVVGSAQGSGVIISPDGYILTAAHVIGGSGRFARVYLHDGRRVIAQTLGTDRKYDAGLLKIEKRAGDNEPWPHVKLGDTTKVQAGQWCLAMGHPGGLQFSSGNPNGMQVSSEPALRLGRILNLDLPSSLTTDCTLIGGDSGGPLFNMQGEVIGIHSRIGSALTANLHVPVNTYQDDWERLVKGDNWGHSPGQEPYLGVQGDADRSDATITRVFSRSPAEKGGIRVGDRIVRFAGRPIHDFDTLKRLVQEHDPGNVVQVEVMRDGKVQPLEVKLARFQD